MKNILAFFQLQENNTPPLKITINRSATFIFDKNFIQSYVKMEQSIYKFFLICANLSTNFNWSNL